MLARQSSILTALHAFCAIDGQTIQLSIIEQNIVYEVQNTLLERIAENKWNLSF
jgi:hypothetical protein